MRAYLKVPGITGCSKSPNRKGWIDVLSYGWGSLTPSAQIHGQQRVERTKQFDLMVVKAMDSSTAEIYEAYLNGTIFGGVRFELTDNQNRVYMKYTLEGVMVAGLDAGQTIDGNPRDEIKLSIDRIQLHHS